MSTQNKTIPYTFSEILSLKPGDLIFGLVYNPQTESFMPGPHWEYSNHHAFKGISVSYPVSFKCFYENKVDWLDALKNKEDTKHKNKKLFYPKEVRVITLPYSPRAPILCNTVYLKLDKIIGMFLGNVVRYSNTSLINVLTLTDNKNIWI